MISNINRSPIKAILLKETYDWRFLRDNPVVERPNGEVIFVSRLLLLCATSSRILIIRTKETGQLHLICQLGVELENENIVEHEELVEYYFKCTKSPVCQLTDIDNPTFTCEWHFPITNESWEVILQQLSKLHVPVLQDFKVGRYDIVRAIWIKSGADYMAFRWSVNKPEYQDTSNMMDTLLNYALIKVNKAYIIPR